MCKATFERVVGNLAGALGGIEAHPGLLFDGGDLAALRERAAAHEELREGVLAKAREIVVSRNLSTEPEPYYSSLPLLETLTAGLMLESSDEMAEHTVALVGAVADAPTWICHVHGGMRCDHCTANTAAALARTCDVLGDRLPASILVRIAERTWELCLHPFIEVCRERSLFWARRDHPFNWRIMTCGESGLGALAFPGPDRLEAVRFALEGVADILDRLPEDGDWEEGPGYWSGTLMHGLRFALALRRLTGGAINLFEHPALRRTADYFTAVTLPDGSVFNYADNRPKISPTALHMIAGQLGIGHLAWTARRIGHATLWDVLFDDPTLEAVEPPAELETRSFATTGIGVSRSSWNEDAVFVGVKSGPTAVGHSHLDINSFVVQKGAVPLLIDPGIWPYGSAIGFFDSGPGGRRWDFDANATLAHNTVLVDGQGQTVGGDCRGELVACGEDGSLRYFVSEAASAYPGLLTKFERWVIHLLPDVVIVYDDLGSEQERHWQWLIHPAGEFSGGRGSHVIENQGVRVSVVRLLPGPDTPWRNVAETRTTYYEDSDFLTDVERTVTTHRLGPMLPSATIEFLWVLHIGDSEPDDWSVDRDGDTLTVRGPVNVVIDKQKQECAGAGGPPP